MEEENFIPGYEARRIADRFNNAVFQNQKWVLAEIKRSAERGEYSCTTGLAREFTKPQIEVFIETLKEFGYVASYTTDSHENILLHISWERSV